MRTPSKHQFSRPRTLSRALSDPLSEHAADKVSGKVRDQDGGCGFAGCLQARHAIGRGQSELLDGPEKPKE
jgi:hypothetical protein